MRNKRESRSNTFSIILGIITILALTLSIILLCLYIKLTEDIRNIEAATVKSETKEIVDFNEIDEEEVMGEDSGTIESGTEELTLETENPESENHLGDNTALFSAFDNTDFFAGLDQVTLNLIRNRMQEMLSSQQFSLLSTLRYFFPDKLIFYDKNAYVFADILPNLEKHTYEPKNFKTNENGEISYWDNDNQISHKTIDVSKYQGTIDWPAVAQDGVEYAFIRLGIRGYQSGAIVLDDTYADNMMNAQNAGIKTGVYFFTQAISEEEAIEEADFVIENLEGYDVQCPVVFDVEMITNGNGRANGLSQEERTDICIAFCDRIEKAGYKPMIYGNIKCFVNMIDLERLESYEKWFAFYDTYLYCPYQISTWQYTENGKVNGINGKVDLNISFQEW